MIQTLPVRCSYTRLHSKMSHRKRPTVQNPFPRKGGSGCLALMGNSGMSCAVESRPGGSSGGPLLIQPEAWLV